MESSARGKPETNKATRQPSLISTAIDASFQADASVREALTENLKPLRSESEAITARLDKAFENFNPGNLSADERKQYHCVAPGADPGNALDSVIMNGVNALRSSDDRRSLTLRDSSELRTLIKAAPKGVASLRGVVDLGELISYINRKSTTSSLALVEHLRRDGRWNQCQRRPIKKH